MTKPPLYLWVQLEDCSTGMYPAIVSSRRKRPDAYEYIRNEAVIETVKARNAFAAEVLELEKEINRLKAGNFTEEEFQNLCHNKQIQDGYECFKQGCNEYQKKLFGKCQNEEELAKQNLSKIDNINQQFKLLGQLKP